MTDQTVVAQDDELAVLTYLPLLDLRDRAARFSELTGIDRNELVLSRFVTTPIPVYPVEWPSGNRRWTGLTPEGLTHPFAWMPDSMAARISDPTEGWEEDDDIWALRVSFELEWRGVLDPDTGVHTDMLERHNLDIEDPDDRARVIGWLEGDPDETLDVIELPALTDPKLMADPNWSLQAAVAYREMAAPRIRRLDAKVMLEDLDAIESAVQGQVESVVGFAMIASECFDNPEWWVSIAETAQRTKHVGSLVFREIRRYLAANTD